MDRLLFMRKEGDLLSVVGSAQLLRKFSDRLSSSRHARAREPTVSEGHLDQVSPELD